MHRRAKLLSQRTVRFGVRILMDMEFAKCHRVQRDRMEKARCLKKRLAFGVWRLAGPAFLIAVPFAASAQQRPSLDLGLDRIAEILILPGGDPRTIIVNLINVALGFLAIIMLVLVVWSGFLFLFSGGKAESIQKAGAVLRNAIIGIIIILSSWAIVRFVLSSFIGAITGTEMTSGEAAPVATSNSPVPTGSSL
jgi:hypothetical protein